MTQFLPSQFIHWKQSGNSHKPEEISEFISLYLDGTVPDYQMSAWLMAVYFRGMNEEETVSLTRAYIESGTTLNLSGIKAPLVDKHSTGGVGDKITLHLAPMLAACGAVVPTITGRGLGFTGGTLDKLESIRGLRTDLSIEEIETFSRKYGLAFGAQTENIVPADRRIYGLRDVTSTVRSIPLIVASILSKKIAEGIRFIVFDVKCGNGAFMKDLEEAEALAVWLVRTAKLFQVDATAVITNMNTPIGTTVGNWLEMLESMRYLEGTVEPPDMHELTLALGSQLLLAAGLTDTLEEAKNRLNEVREDGSASRKLQSILKAQGGEQSEFHLPFPDKKAGKAITVTSPETGYLKSLNARDMGILAITLGAGRRTIESRIDPLAGIRFLAKPGDHVHIGEPIATLYTSPEISTEMVIEQYLAAVCFSRTQPSKEPMVLKVISARSIQ